MGHHAHPSKRGIAPKKAAKKAAPKKAAKKAANMPFAVIRKRGR